MPLRTRAHLLFAKTHARPTHPAYLEQDLIDELEPEILADPGVLAILREQNKYDLRLFEFAAECWRRDREAAALAAEAHDTAA